MARARIPVTFTLELTPEEVEQLEASTDRDHYFGVLSRLWDGTVTASPLYECAWEQVCEAVSEVIPVPSPR